MEDEITVPKIGVSIYNPKDVDVVYRISVDVPEDLMGDKLEHRFPPFSAPSIHLAVHKGSEQVSICSAGAYEDEYLRDETKPIAKADSGCIECPEVEPVCKKWNAETQYNVVKIWIPVCVSTVDSQLKAEVNFENGILKRKINRGSRNIMCKLPLQIKIFEHKSIKCEDPGVIDFENKGIIQKCVVSYPLKV